jgi:uncharacterized membrane protein YesL
MDTTDDIAPKALQPDPLNPFLIFWRAGRDTFDELFLMIGLNLLFVLLVGPLTAIAVVMVLNGAALIAAPIVLVNALLLGPASAGLLNVAERIVQGRVASFQLFFQGMRQYRVLSWQVYGIWTAGLITLLFNLYFYTQLQGFLGIFLTVLLAYLTYAWCTLLIYLGPLMLLQETKSLRLLFRNALIMVFGRPIFTIVTSITMGILLTISVWFGILALILTFAFFALWGMRATRAIIADAEKRRQEREGGSTPATGEQVPLTDRGRGGQIRSRK